VKKVGVLGQYLEERCSVKKPEKFYDDIKVNKLLGHSSQRKDNKGDMNKISDDFGKEGMWNYDVSQYKGNINEDEAATKLIEVNTVYLRQTQFIGHTGMFRPSIIADV
jgi:hypothetical protein